MDPCKGKRFINRTSETLFGIFRLLAKHVPIIAMVVVSYIRAVLIIILLLL